MDRFKYSSFLSKFLLPISNSLHEPDLKNQEKFISSDPQVTADQMGGYLRAKYFHNNLSKIPPQKPKSRSKKTSFSNRSNSTQKRGKSPLLKSKKQSTSKISQKPKSKPKSTPHKAPPTQPQNFTTKSSSFKGQDSGRGNFLEMPEEGKRNKLSQRYIEKSFGVVMGKEKNEVGTYTHMSKSYKQKKAGVPDGYQNSRYSKSRNQNFRHWRQDGGWNYKTSNPNKDPKLFAFKETHKGYKNIHKNQSKSKIKKNLDLDKYSQKNKKKYLRHTDRDLIQLDNFFQDPHLLQHEKSLKEFRTRKPSKAKMNNWVEDTEQRPNSARNPSRGLYQLPKSKIIRPNYMGPQMAQSHLNTERISSSKQSKP